MADSPTPPAAPSKDLPAPAKAGDQVYRPGQYRQRQRELQMQRDFDTAERTRPSATPDPDLSSRNPLRRITGTVRMATRKISR